MDVRVSIPPTSLQQKYLGIRILGQATGQSASRRAGAYDYVAICRHIAPRAAPCQRLTATYTTPCARNFRVSSALTPHSAASTSAVCSPSSGGRVTSAGESDSFTGQPTVW